MKNNHRIKVCQKDNCVEATGKYADAIAGALTFTLISIGIVALVKATAN